MLAALIALVSLDVVAVLDLQWAHPGRLLSCDDTAPFQAALESGVRGAGRVELAPTPPHSSQCAACEWCDPALESCSEPCATWIPNEGRRRAATLAIAGYVHEWPGGEYVVVRRVRGSSGDTEAVLAERCDGCSRGDLTRMLERLGKRIVGARARRVAVSEMPERLQLRTVSTGPQSRKLADAVAASGLGPRIARLECVSAPDFGSPDAHLVYWCSPKVSPEHAARLHHALEEIGAPHDAWSTKVIFEVRDLACDRRRGRCSFVGY